MNEIVGHLVPVITAAALCYGLAAFAATRSIRVAVPVLLDLLLVVGLLRLSTTGSWTAIGSAAMVVLVRKIAVQGITVSRRSASKQQDRSPRTHDV